MKITSKRAVLIGAIAATVITLTACSDVAPGATPATPGALTQDQVVAKAPVADSLPDSPTITAIREKKTLNYGGSPDRALFSQFDPATNSYQGFEAGLAYMFSRYVLGEPSISFTAATTVNREALLQNGTVQFVASGYSVTPQRAELVDFAGPYLESGTAIGLSASNKTIKSLTDLNGKTVGTLAGLTETSVLQAIPKAKVITFDSPAELVNVLLQGRVDAIGLDLPSLLGAVAKNKGKMKLYSPKPINTLYFGIGTPKSDPAFKKIVNDWLRKIEKDGSYAKLWEATVGDYAPVPTPPEIGSVPGS